MATDSFIKLREMNATGGLRKTLRVNTHRILAYYAKGLNSPGSVIVMNIGGVTYEVEETPDEIDKLVVMAKEKEHKKHGDD